MRPCVTRLLAHLDPLKKYFSDHQDVDKRGKVKSINAVLQAKTTKPLLLFIQSVLKSVDGYNKKFQVSYLCKFLLESSMQHNRILCV